MGGVAEVRVGRCVERRKQIDNSRRRETMSTINVPDDEKTIQGAVNRAHDGDTVVVHGESEAEPTLYESVSVGFDTASNITVRAEPRRSVEVHNIGTTGAAGEGLVLEGFRVAGGVDVHAVYIASPNVTIRDFSILNAAWAAIYVSPDNPDLPGGTIENCHIYGCGTGIHTHGVGWKVLNNDIERLREHGTGRDVDAMRGWGQGLFIEGNWIHGTTFDETGSAHVDGFQTFDKKDERQLHGLVFRGNIVEDVHQGLIFEDVLTPADVSDVLIYNNWFRNIQNAGVLAKDGVRNVRVRHNLFQNIGGGANNGTGVFARYGAEVYVYANVFADSGSNYKGGDPGGGGERLTGGYNILNRQGWPNYSREMDILDHDPMLDADGYATSGQMAPNGLPIGRIRPDTPVPDPEPEEEPEGHEHVKLQERVDAVEDAYAIHEQEHARLEALLDIKSEIGHEHGIPVHDHPEYEGPHSHHELSSFVHVHSMSNETRLMFEMLAEADGALAQQIRDRLGE